MADFTPGPWEVGYHSTGGNRDGALIVDKETGTNVASLWVTLRTISEVDANARLIAAAPEMHEALTTIFQAFVDNEIKFTKKRWSDSEPHYNANILMCAAIAKAEGR